LKILALVIIFILLIHRIKNTPGELSKHLYNKKIEKYIERQKKSFEPIKDEKILNISKATIILCSAFIELFLLIFYMILGTKIGTTEFKIMSTLKILICIYDIRILFDGRAFSQDINDYKFNRLLNLFSVILDYVYYVSAIYILLK
jgi:hypothetical protein